MALTGWAVLAQRLEPADAVLLTYDDAQGEAILFDAINVVDHRPDIVRATEEPGYFSSGWRRLFSIAQLPPNAGAVKAWAYDAELRRAWRLPGEATFHR